MSSVIFFSSESRWAKSIHWAMNISLKCGRESTQTIWWQWRSDRSMILGSSFNYSRKFSRQLLSRFRWDKMFFRNSQFCLLRWSKRIFSVSSKLLLSRFLSSSRNWFTSSLLCCPRSLSCFWTRSLRSSRFVNSDFSFSYFYIDLSNLSSLVLC